ncbi:MULTISPECIES: RNA polymerase subunit sigma-70 [Clostridia]|uniref:RNA polymerase subunit sigma-70 n=1 Tax=Clostridia TaxID=186801 RepID=UPI00067E6DEC|nr:MULTISPECIES: RNA polymerase subunit sigma-70 [Clostridia]
MDKKILEDYIDACAILEQTEAEIKRLKRKQKAVVKTNVEGSNPEWPYEKKHFTIQGTTLTYRDDGQLRIEEQIKERQKKDAEELKLMVEEWMLTIPFRMRRIIEYKFFHELTWEEVAKLMGRKCTGDSVRMEFNNFMKK